MEVHAALSAHGIRPTRQRVAIARYLLVTEEHPSADRIWEQVRTSLPSVSRATVYNTLALFEEKGLIRSHALGEGAVVYDPRIEPHHHFVDEVTGKIHDLPWNAVRVEGVEGLEGFEVSAVQVVLRGRKSES